MACSLEENVGNAFIDVVLKIDRWVLSIENKIYNESAEDKQQLVKQYKGLKEALKGKDKANIVVVFLVPINGEVLHPYVEGEFNELSVKEGDFKTIVTWQKAIDQNGVELRLIKGLPERA